MKTRKFYYEYAGELKECRNIEMNGYFLAGYQTPEDTGKLCTLAMSVDGATILTPVFNENKQTICRPEYAGREVKALNINLNNL